MSVTLKPVGAGSSCCITRLLLIAVFKLYFKNSRAKEKMQHSFIYEVQYYLWKVIINKNHINYLTVAQCHTV
ncbi:hypothetical protein LAA29_70163 [Leuconostoc carnosum]|nr:hypothetical protein LAA29_70163 [Leuconostoc carnosum]